MRTAPIDGYVQIKAISTFEHLIHTIEYVITTIQHVINDTKAKKSTYRLIGHIWKMNI